MQYYQTFTVKTNFTFPIDMLRYDQCFPESQVDSAKITNNLMHPGKEFLLEVRLARFVGHKGFQPTVERWNSFQCEVSNVEVRK